MRKGYLKIGRAAILAAEDFFVDGIGGGAAVVFLVCRGGWFGVGRGRSFSGGGAVCLRFGRRRFGGGRFGGRLPGGG